MAHCFSNKSNKKKNFPAVVKKTIPSCKFPFLSPLIHPVERFCNCELPYIHESDTTCEYRPLLALGFFWMFVLRKVLMPFTGGVYAFGIVHAAKKVEPTCDTNRTLLRPADLPIYPDERQCRHCVEVKSAAECPEKNLLEETISCARQELWFLMDQTKIVKAEVAEALGNAMESASNGLDFLREEENLAPRVGAIALGGITGFIFGLRKGLFTRLFYTTIGAGTMAALCYPSEAKEYSTEALDQARKYTLIGYHFLNGDLAVISNETFEDIIKNLLFESKDIFATDKFAIFQEVPLGKFKNNLLNINSLPGEALAGFTWTVKKRIKLFKEEAKSNIKKVIYCKS